MRVAGSAQILVTVVGFGAEPEFAKGFVIVIDPKSMCSNFVKVAKWQKSHSRETRRIYAGLRVYDVVYARVLGTQGMRLPVSNSGFIGIVFCVLRPGTRGTRMVVECRGRCWGSGGALCSSDYDHNWWIAGVESDSSTLHAKKYRCR